MGARQSGPPRGRAEHVPVRRPPPRRDDVRGPSAADRRGNGDVRDGVRRAPVGHSPSCNRVVAAAAVVVATATPMFFVYGSMLDTPITSFPLALAVLLLWKRQRDARPVAAALTGTVCALAALAGWEATLLVGIVTCAIAVEG